ncbi:MAG TPA: 3,4-dihydroxy-2-butanone-4-phosphate synthase, partial [Arthrobacter sp.]
MNAAVHLESSTAAGPVSAAAPATPGTPARGLDSIDDAVRAMAAGRPVLVVDNEDRE